MLETARSYLAGVTKNCYSSTHIKLIVSKEELEKLVWEMPSKEVGKLFNVSDKAIEKSW